MIKNIYIQEGGFSQLGKETKEKIYFLTIRNDEEQLYKIIKILFEKKYRNEKEVYVVKGIIYKTDYTDFEIGKVPFYFVNSFQEFQIYEISFSEELKEKFNSITKKGLEFIENHKKNEIFNSISSKNYKIKQYNKVSNYLNELLNLIEGDIYDI